MVSCGLRRLAAPLRPAPLLVLALLIAGCTGAPTPPPPAPEEPAMKILALDGRWPFPEAMGAALLTRAGAPAPRGALVMGEALAARSVADFAGLDAAAAAALDLTPPPPGEALVTSAFAAREGLTEGAPLDLRAHAWPRPYVATYFEMERTPSCERRPDAKLCFMEPEPGNVARLQLRVDEGARDAAFLPDLVELGPGARPAWWNGSFTSPAGERTPFSAHAPLSGEFAPGEYPGAMSPGPWVIRFALEANGELAPAGAAGILRVREPGFLWFDDRLQLITDPQEQARSVLANATPTHATMTRTRIADVNMTGIDIVLHIDDARRLAGTQDVTALLVDLTPTNERALDAARGPDGVTLALRTRAPTFATIDAPPARALVFAAPAGIDVATLPPVEGAGAPSLALGGRAPHGEPANADGARVDAPLLLLAHADGPAPFTLPAGGRWTSFPDALENLSRSRTLALASEDMLLAPIATMRLAYGEGNTTRSMVAIGGVHGGPSATLWTSAALVAGSGQPAAPRVILPLAEGADAADVAERALAAWREHGLVLDR